MFRPITTKLLHKGIHLNRTLTIGRRLPVLQSANKPAENLLVSYIPGDGVYPELMEQVKTVFREAKYPITFQDCPMSEVAPEGKMTLPEVLSSIRKNKVCIKGIIQTPMTNVGMQNLNMQLRKSLDLFANVCRAHSLTGFSTRHNNLDIVVIREQTEGEYSALEHESIPGVVECLKIMTRRKCQHIAKFAFDFALRNGRKKVTAVHKANIMKLGDGLFLECVREVADLYPQIVFEAMIVDNCCMQLVSNPYQFDILVMPNLYGSIIDNLASGLVGGAGVVPGESYSHEVAIFEPAARHTYSAAKGQNIANPTAVLLSAVSMLRHVNLTVYAENLDKAIKGVIKKGRVRTRDLGGQSSTTEFTEAVIEELKKIQSQA